MDEAGLVSLFSESPVQFVIAVLVLVFGTKKILSEENVKHSLSGVGYVRSRLQAAAKRRAASEVAKELTLAEDNKRLQREVLVSRGWRVYVEGYVHDLELWFSARGEKFPLSPFKHFIDWRGDND